MGGWEEGRAKMQHVSDKEVGARGSWGTGTELGTKAGDREREIQTGDGEIHPQSDKW